MSKVFHSITVSQIKQMLDIQNAAEVRLDPNWKTANWEFDTAIMVECVELIEHLPWKWWKDINKQVNMKQVHLELVDIWHFGMCIMLIADRENDHPLLLEEDLYSMLTNMASNLPEFDAHLAAIDAGEVPAMPSMMAAIKANVKEIMTDAAANYFNCGRFFMLCYVVGLHPLELYKLYIAKNVLNQFRQLNGYKEGTYIKVWQGREDNEWLMDILNENPVITADKLMIVLTDMYKLKTYN